MEIADYTCPTTPASRIICPKHGDIGSRFVAHMVAFQMQDGRELRFCTWCIGEFCEAHLPQVKEE